MAAIFKNGGYVCRISQNAQYLKLEDQKMYILSQKETFYLKLFMNYGKASFLFSMAAILNIEKMVEASKSQVASIKILK